MNFQRVLKNGHVPGEHDVAAEFEKQRREKETYRQIRRRRAAVKPAKPNRAAAPGAGMPGAVNSMVLR